MHNQKNIDATTDFFEAQGWSPWEPSDDCLEIVRRPKMPDTGLTEHDRLGIHQNLLEHEVFRLFHKHIRKNWSNELGLGIEGVALLHALRESGFDIHALRDNKDALIEYGQTARELRIWELERLQPSIKLVRQMVKEKLDISPTDRHEFEPGFTCICVHGSRDVYDFEGTRAAVRRGVLLAEKDGVPGGDLSSAERADLNALNWSDSEIGELIEMMLERDGARRLFYVTDAGLYRVGDTKMRDAFRKEIGKLRKPGDRGRAVNAGERVVDLPSNEKPVDESVGDRIDLQDFRERIQAARASLSPDDPRGVVIDHFDELRSRNLTFKELAERTGHHRNRLSEEFRKLMKAMKDLEG